MVLQNYQSVILGKRKASACKRGRSIPKNCNLGLQGCHKRVCFKACLRHTTTRSWKWSVSSSLKFCLFFFYFVFLFLFLFFRPAWNFCFSLGSNFCYYTGFFSSSFSSFFSSFWLLFHAQQSSPNQGVMVFTETDAQFATPNGVMLTLLQGCPVVTRNSFLGSWISTATPSTKITHRVLLRLRKIN